MTPAFKCDNRFCRSHASPCHCPKRSGRSSGRSRMGPPVTGPESRACSISEEHTTAVVPRNLKELGGTGPPIVPREWGERGHPSYRENEPTAVRGERGHPSYRENGPRAVRRNRKPLESPMISGLIPVEDGHVMLGRFAQLNSPYVA